MAPEIRLLQILDACVAFLLEAFDVSSASALRETLEGEATLRLLTELLALRLEHLDVSGYQAIEAALVAAVASIRVCFVTHSYLLKWNADKAADTV